MVENENSKSSDENASVRSDSSDDTKKSGGLRLNIGIKLIGLVVASTMVSVLLTGIASYVVAQKELHQAAETKITALSTARHAAISDFLTAVSQDIRSVAVNNLAIDGLTALTGTWKSLADQTAKATEEIGSQVLEIEGATSEAVDTIQGIGDTIGKIDGIAATIAASIEEQASSTGEIATSVQSGAAGTQEVSGNIADVTEAAGKTGEAATGVLGATQEMNRQSEVLRKAVAEFLDNVKAA